MSKKSKQSRNRLALVFLVLLVAVIAIQINKSKKGERSFKAELLEFNTEEVSSLSIYSPENGQNPFIVSNENDNWNIESDGKSFDADNDMVENMINELAELKATQKVAASKDKWADYDVTDSVGVRVVVNSNDKPVGDIYIGRFSYNQNTRKPKTYVRLNKEKDVFAVEGYLSMTFNQGINGLRNKAIFQGNKNDLTRLTFSYPADSSFTLIKDSLGWNMNGMPADSATVSNYLGSVSYLSGSTFRDDLDAMNFSTAPYSVIIEGNNMSSVEIKAIQDEQGKAAILSNANPRTVFDASTMNLFQKIFIGPGSLLPKND
jgi:hypothetical protein